MERCLGRGKKKSVAKTEDFVSGMRKKSSSSPKKYKSLGKAKDTEASARFKMITERAKKIRQSHPKMKWKNCIKQASQELYK